MTAPAHDIAAPAFRLDHAHPNRDRWQRAIDTATTRGELVCSLLGEVMVLAGSDVLDIGCGVGGTSIALRNAGARVTALDRDPRRLAALREQDSRIESVQGEASNPPFPAASFDAAILQDVIEHTQDPERVIAAAARILKPAGILYLSTPNRFSLPVLLSDPHWGLPLIALFRRPALHRALRILRPGDAGRTDLAQLLSKKELFPALERHGFSASVRNRSVARMMFQRPEMVVWSDGHRRIIRWLSAFHLRRLCLRLVRSRPGFTDFFFTPAWYLVCRKEAR